MCSQRPKIQGPPGWSRSHYWYRSLFYQAFDHVESLQHLEWDDASKPEDPCSRRHEKLACERTYLRAILLLFKSHNASFLLQLLCSFLFSVDLLLVGLLSLPFILQILKKRQIITRNDEEMYCDKRPEFWHTALLIGFHFFCFINLWFILLVWWKSTV